MKFYRNLIVVLFFCFCVFSIASARILWNKELIFNENTNSIPLASCVNKDQNGVFVITKTGPKGAFVSGKGDCTLWEIGADGNIARRDLFKDANRDSIQTSAIAIRPGCAMASDSLGNLLTAGVLTEQRQESSLTVITTSREAAADPNILPSRKINISSIKKMISLRNDEFALIGDRSNDGLYLRIDNEGTIKHEIQFDRGRGEMFSGVAEIKQDNLSLAIVGSSFEISADVFDNFILIYDPNDTLIHEDYFMGARLAMGSVFPRVCFLGNGNLVVVFHNKLDQDSKGGLWARCYTQKLELLWEKKMFSTDKSSILFDVTSYNSNGFGIAILTSLKGLKFYSFNENGNKIGFAEYKGMAGISGFNLMRINGRSIAVFEEGGPGRIDEFTIKTKVIAFD